MPIYEYHCLECNSVFEKLVSLHTDSMNCESCQSPRVEKLFSSFAVQASGSPSSFSSASGPCGSCGAPRQGMCQEMD
jgi:putative FmdB family regulatory protein